MILFEFFPGISLLAFASILIGKIYSLKKSKVEISSGSGKNQTRKILLYPVYILLLIIILLEFIDPIIPATISILPDFLSQFFVDSNFLKYSGVILVLISLVTLFITLKHFGNSFRTGLNTAKRGKLVTSGIFSVSRNPFFVSIGLYITGITLLLPNLFFTIIVLLSYISIHFFILKEEKFMLKNYGQEYENYFKKVGRYFSF